MRVELYKVAVRDAGFLAVMPRPRGGDWLEDEVAELKSLGVTTIASLLESEEEAELALSHEKAAVCAAGMTFLAYSIRDRDIPSNTESFVRFVHALRSRITSGEGVAVHCRAGIGRSGLTAAAVLVALGHPHDEAFDTVSSARGIGVPDTGKQFNWFEDHWQLFRHEA